MHFSGARIQRSRVFSQKGFSAFRGVTAHFSEFRMVNKYDYEQKLFSQITQASTTPVSGSSLEEKKYQAFDRVNKALVSLGFDFDRNSFGENLLPPVIHVAGTKGKGSVCSFCESILREKGLKTGLFTSPHLIHVSERIKLNSHPISEDKLQYYVDKVMGILEEKKSLENLGFFRLMSVLAFYVFAHEDLDVAIVEVGLGGLLDATNILKHKSVTAVTLLDYDHMSFLGETIELIAAQKAGIFLEETPALTIGNQLPQAMNVLRKTAEEKKVELEVVERDYLEKEGDFELGLKGSHQIENASLAVRICEILLQQERIEEKVLKEALKKTKYAGRCQFESIEDLKTELFLDGAHTEKSMEAAVGWLNKSIPEEEKDEGVSVVFNCAHTKDVVGILKQLMKIRNPIEKVYFVKPMSFKPTSAEVPTLSQLLKEELDEGEMGWQETLGECWKKLRERSGREEVKVDVGKKIEKVVQEMKEKAPEEKKQKIFVTGSLLLVGDVLKLFGFSHEKI